MEIWKYHFLYDNYMASNLGNIKNIKKKENCSGKIILGEKGLVDWKDFFEAAKIGGVEAVKLLSAL